MIGSPFADAREGAAKVHDSATGALIVELERPASRKDSRFGAALAISGSRVAVSAPGEPNLNGSSGKVYVYDLLSATPGTPQLTIAAPVSNSDLQFGHSIALDGSRLVVGACHSDLESPGAAYLFELGSTSPDTVVQAFANPDPASNDGFGHAVALDGDRVAIGAPKKATSNGQAGCVLIYQLQSPTPIIATTIVFAPTPVDCGFFGFALALEEDRLVVSSYHDGTGEIDDGIVHSFDLSNGTTANLEFSFPAPQGTSRSRFGHSIDLAGNLLIIGNPDGMTIGAARGSACLFDLDRPNPTSPVLIFTPPASDPCVGFGSGVTVADGRVLVAAPYAGEEMSHLGRAYLFDPIGPSPQTPVASLHQLLASEATHFGSVVAMKQGLMAIGAPYDDSAGVDAGAVFLYDSSTGDPGVAKAVIHGPQPSPYNHFGSALDISGDLLVIGVPQHDGQLLNLGRAYVFDVSGPIPVLIATLDNPSPGSDDTFGGSVAISGSRVLVGAHRADSSQENSGAVYLFDLESPTPSIPRASIANPAPDTGDFFGASVAISGNRIAIGTPQDDSIKNNAGMVYLYDLPASGPPVLLGEIAHPAADSGDLFGASISLDSVYLAVGAFGDDTDLAGDTDEATGTQTGSAMVFDVSGATARLVTMLNSPGELDNAGYGAAVAVDGTRVLIGALGQHPDHPAAGLIHAYDMSSPSPAAPVAVLFNPASFGNSGFGTALAISGKQIVIGAPSSDTAGPQQGAAHLFEPYSAQIHLELFGQALAPGAFTDMGTTALGDTKTLYLRITNSGNGALNLSPPLWSGEVEHFACPTLATISVPPLGGYALPVSFTPSGVPRRTATLTLNSDSVVDPHFPLVFSGEATSRDGLYHAWTNSAGLTGSQALPDAMPYNEGVANIIKYAFNLDGSRADPTTLPPGSGLAGLPRSSIATENGQTYFQLEFLRRKGSGLRYRAKSSTNLAAGSFTLMTADEKIQDIDTTWERVILREPVHSLLSPRKFAVLEVSFP